MANIRVFTFNMRTDAACDGRNAFSAERSAYIEKEFPKYEADVIGFQETRPEMRQWVIDHFPAYTVCGIGREADLQGESNIIAYRTDRFDLVSLDTFWLSDTPHRPGSRFATDQSSCPRICTVVTLRCKENGRLFRHYNTHLDHVGAFAQAQGISLILNRMVSDYQTWQMPVILTGDFNVTPESKVYATVNGFGGCGDALVDVSADVGFTFHAYQPEKTQEKIDYIFTNIPADLTKSMKATDNEDGIYLSDHYPVGAIVSLD